MTLDQGATRTAYRPLAILLSCFLLMSVGLTWTYLGMRAVMDVGGSCASGGPYEIAQPCPDGAVLLSVAIPIMVVTAMLGSAIAVRLMAPGLLVAMWAVLFGSLGWNFLEYGFGSGDGLVWGWIVCGVVFELMALPAVGVIVAAARGSLTSRSAVAAPTRATWLAAYAVLGLAGAAVGWWSFDALS
jgi:hypothetical protein